MSTGILQYADYGVGAATTASLGTVTGGEVGPGVANVTKRKGIGGQSQNVGGLIEIAGSVDFLPQGTSCLTFINSALRTGYTSPALTGLAIEGGTTDHHAYLHTGCYISTARMSCAVNEAFSASVSWMGTGFTRTASPSPNTKQTGATFEWFLGSVTIDTGTYDVQSWEVEVNNSLRPYSSLDTKSAESKRFPEGINIGSEVVTCNLVLMSPLDNSTIADLTADSIDVDIDVVLVATNGTQTETITLSDLACNTNPMPFAAPDGDVLWNVELVGDDDNASCITMAAS